MKKSIITLSFLAFTIFGYSQTIKVKDGKATQCIPAVEVVISKEEVLRKKQFIESEIKNNEKQHDILVAKQKEIQDVCDKLGYK